MSEWEGRDWRRKGGEVVGETGSRQEEEEVTSE